MIDLLQQQITIIIIITIIITITITREGRPLPLQDKLTLAQGFQGLMKTWWALEVGGWLTVFLKGGGRWCMCDLSRTLYDQRIVENIFV